MQVGPVGLVPFAWAFTAATHVPALVSEVALLIALSVMDVFLLTFLVVSRGRMEGPALSAWQGVLALGLLATAGGTLDLVVDPAANPVVPVALLAWMVLPAYAYVRTGEDIEERAWVFHASGGLSALGGVVYALGLIVPLHAAAPLFAGIGLVGVGQSLGIVYTGIRY